MLGPLQDNGGQTFTHALLPGSPAIDAGDTAFSAPQGFDQRGPGYPRVVNGRVDIGAFEVQSGVPVLSIRAAANGLVLGWPGWASNFRLQQNLNLNASSWTSNTLPVVIVNGTNQVTFSPVNGSLFFRLIGP